MSELPAIRLKRLQMRSMRRGIKEMALIVSRYAQAKLAVFDAVSLDCYEDLLNENDQDLYQWVSGQAPSPPRISEMIEDIQAFIAQARG